MFLAIRELTFARGRFGLMGAVVALISVLVVLLSGLAVGLTTDGVSALQKLPVTSFAFQQDVSESSAFSRSVVGPAAVDAWQAQPGVDHAAPFGNTLVNAKTDRGVEIDLALFGVEIGSFIDPEVAEGARLAGEGEVVISATAAEEGVAVGDTVIVEPTGTQLKVVGILEGQHTFGHVDVGYVALRSWQGIKAGMRPGDVVPDHVYQEFTAVAVKMQQGASVNTKEGDRAAGTTSLSRKAAFDASPGYSAETSTLQLIQGFLYGISALVVGSFFTVWTIQRKPEIAVLRAMGASKSYLLRESILQSLVLLVISATVGVGAGLAMGAAIARTSMPFALETGPLIGAILLLLILGLIGAAIAVLRVTRVDPLIALGGSR
jgi:putative ABC transport system permease protein